MHPTRLISRRALAMCNAAPRWAELTKWVARVHLSLFCQVGGAVGERRTVKWSPGGLHFGGEVDLAQFIEGCVLVRGPHSHSPAALPSGIAKRLTDGAARPVGPTACRCVVENFPEGCDPAVARDAARDALTEHIHGIVSTNYKQLEDELSDFL